ncbi:hypothetical protein KKF61_07895 [Patescibacteria group bacterium]|nr:hypothetical protein [Patescibacteria group bacterium]
MAADDQRYYETFYAIQVDDWDWDFSSKFSNHHKILDKEYISDGCSTTTSSTATATNEFLYPHHIKKTYFIEGVIRGHITLAASACTTTITSYRVGLYKVSSDDPSMDEELCSTGIKTVNSTLVYDGTYNVGEERVYPFWIDVWEEKKLTENERFYLRVEVFSSDNCSALWHSNDATWEDIKIEIPFKL